MIVVKATFDDEAGVWVARSADLPGLWIEADSVEALNAKLPGAILDLLEDGVGPGADYDVPVELIAHASSRVHVRAAS